MKIELEIKKIVVMHTNGTDRITIYTDLPAQFPGWLPDEAATLDTECAAELGVDWVQCAFGVDPDEVINARSTPSSFCRQPIEDEEGSVPVPSRKYPLQQKAAARVAKRLTEGKKQVQGYMDSIRK